MSTATHTPAPSSESPAGGGPAAPLSAGAVADLARLRTLVAEVRGRTRRWIWIESLALVGLLVAAVFWGTLAFDWAVEPPSWARAVLVALALGGLVWLLRQRLLGRLATPMGDAAMATLLERGHVGFHDSLSTAIELADRRRDDVDLRLLERTVHEAAAMVDRVDPGTLFRRGRLRALALAGALAAASVAGLAIVRPAIAGLWSRRMLLLDEAPWPRRTLLVPEGFVDGVRKVARGSDVDLVVRADAAREVPEVVELRSRAARRGPWRTERMGTRGGVSEGHQAFGHQLKGVTEDVEIEVRGGDARVRGLRLAVVDSPALDTLAGEVTLPDYLGGAIRPISPSRVIQVPRGSSVAIRFVATKPLRSATILAVAEGVETTLAEESGFPAERGAEGERSIAVGIGPVEGERTLVARFTDTDGLANREPISVVLSAIPDEAPQAAVRMRGISTAVTAQARIPLTGVVSDDHALESAAVSIAVRDGAVTRVPVERVRAGAALVEFTEDSPETLDLTPFALAPGNGLSVQLTARDGCTLPGGPNEGGSDAWSLDVVTPEALMAMLEAREILLRRRFESVVSDLGLARERLAAGEGASAAGEGGESSDADEAAGLDWTVEAMRLAESSSRASGETAEIAEAFRVIRAELDNNRMLTEELDGRLVVQIAAPLAGLATTDLPALSTVARQAKASDRATLVARTDDVLARMRAVLDKMMELESYNEVIELLRGVIRTQEEIRAETLKRQRQRAKEALERP